MAEILLYGMPKLNTLNQIKRDTEISECNYNPVQIKHNKIFSPITITPDKNIWITEGQFPVFLNKKKYQYAVGTC